MGKWRVFEIEFVHEHRMIPPIQSIVDKVNEWIYKQHRSISEIRATHDALDWCQVNTEWHRKSETDPYLLFIFICLVFRNLLVAAYDLLTRLMLFHTSVVHPYTVYTCMCAHCARCTHHQYLLFIILRWSFWLRIRLRLRRAERTAASQIHRWELRKSDHNVSVSSFPEMCRNEKRSRIWVREVNACEDTLTIIHSI